MSTWDDFLNATGASNDKPGGNTQAPSSWDQFLSTAGREAHIVGSAVARGAADSIPYIVDVLGSVAQASDPGSIVAESVNPNLGHKAYDNLDNNTRMVGRAIGGQGLATSTVDQAAAKITQAPTPKNTWEEFLQSGGMGVGGMLGTGEAKLPSLITGAISGLTGQAAHEAFPESNVAPAIGALLGGGVAHAGIGARPSIPEITQHPEFEQGFQAILNREGGGTIEAPKTNPTSGAFGPAQVMPDTLRDPGHGITPWNGTVEDSVRVGKDLYSKFLDKYNGDMSKALGAYDWGDGNLDHAVEKYGNQWLDHAPEETQNYVNRSIHEIYGGNISMAGSTGGEVPSMAANDIHSAMPMDDELTKQLLSEPEHSQTEPTIAGNDISTIAGIKNDDLGNVLSSHLDTAHSVLQDYHETGESDISPEQVEAYRRGAEEVLNAIPEDHPLYSKAVKAVDLWHKVQVQMDEEPIGDKPDIGPLHSQGSDSVIGQEPIEARPANDNPSTPEQPAASGGGAGGGGSGMGGDFGGGQPPSSEGGDPKYADSVNLNRIKITDDAKQLIKDQLLPVNTDIETHQENIVKAMSYIDRHGAENILSGFHKVSPDELAPYQTAVRALSSAGKQNVADLARQFPDERTRTPEQSDTIRNAIEMAGRATTLDNSVAKQLGRSMSARRIYMGGNSELSKLLDGSHIDNDALNKIVDTINKMPSQAGDIAADALKPGWADYVKSTYYGVLLLSRLTTSIGIFASVSVSHLTEALTHSVAAMTTMPFESRAWVAWERGWAKGFNDLPSNIKQAWQKGIPTDKASLIQSRVNLPGVLGFPSKLISATDEFFGTLGRSAKAYSDAAQRAYSEGFRGDKFAARVNELVNNMSPKEQAAVTDYGKFARLQDSPTPLGRLFKAAVNNKNPIISLPATVFLPFVNIADRLLMYSIRMTPGLSFTDRLTRADFASNPTGKAVAINRQLLGAGLASYAVSQVISGNMTGQGPSDPEKKGQWAFNHQPDSIKIDGHWVSYSRLPFSSLLSAAATATERYKETGNGKDYMKTIEGMFIGAGAGLLHSHYLEGVANLADTASSGSADKLEDFFGRSVRSFIPGILQQVNESVIDPIQRDTRAHPFVDNIKAGIPGESQTLPAKHDVYGQTETYSGGASRLVNPFQTKPISNDSTVNTLDKLSAETGKSVVTPAAKTIHLNGNPVKLSEQGYQKYQALSGQIFKQNMSQYIGEMSSMTSEDRIKLVKQTLRDARSQAKAQLWGD